MISSALPNPFVAPLEGERLVRSTDIRLSEIISALSLALDLTHGVTQGHCMRSCIIGMRIASHLELTSDDRSSLFYALLLKDLGCSSNAAKLSYMFGNDDHTVKRSMRLIDWSRPAECLKHAWNHCVPEKSWIAKTAKVAGMLKLGREGARDIAETRCERGATIAQMLQLSDGTAQAIRDLDEHWNGAGNPRGKKGEEISLLGRICGLSQCVEIFKSEYDLASAMTMAEQRNGKWFDPELVAVLKSFENDTEFWNSLAGSDLVSIISQLEPEDQILVVDEAGVDRIAEAFAQVVDAKSPWTYLHSSRVAEIAVGVANELGIEADMVRDIRRVGLLHDIGKLGVSNQVLDKPKNLTDSEFAQIRKHPEYSYRVLQRIPSFRELAEVAGAHHERLDGRGYFRGLAGEQICHVTRILTIADVCEALTASRPYRKPLDWEQTRSVLKKDLNTAFDPVCFEALCIWYEREAATTRAEQQVQMVCTLVDELRN